MDYVNADACNLTFLDKWGRTVNAGADALATWNGLYSTEAERRRAHDVLTYLRAFDCPCKPGECHHS